MKIELLGKRKRGRPKRRFMDMVRGRHAGGYRGQEAYDSLWEEHESYGRKKEKEKEEEERLVRRKKEKEKEEDQGGGRGGGGGFLGYN